MRCEEHSCYDHPVGIVYTDIRELWHHSALCDTGTTNTQLVPVLSVGAFQTWRWMRVFPCCIGGYEEMDGDRPWNAGRLAM